MREFAPMAHGTHGWDEQYNNDMGLLFGEMAGVKANNVLNIYTHSKTGTTHALTGEGTIMRFYATAPWAAGDAIAVNGEAVNPITLDGAALPAGGFVSGMWVVAVKDGKNLQFLTQSYAGVFADINSQLANKANNSYGGLNCVNLLEWAIQQTQSGPFVVDPAITTEGLPVRGLWYTGHLDVGAVGGSWSLTLRGNKVIYVNETSEGVWSDWDSYYAATPPQVFDLALGEHVVIQSGYPSKYWRNSFGEVGVLICLAIPENVSLQGAERIAMLPEGFHPQERVIISAGFISKEVRQGGASIDILQDGSIHYFGPELTFGDTLWGTTTFVAQGD